MQNKGPARKSNSKSENASGDVKTLSLDAGIYKLSAVRKAARDYSKFAQFDIRKEDGVIRVEMAHIADTVKESIESEFCNYVLWKLRN